MKKTSVIRSFRFSIVFFLFLAVATLRPIDRNSYGTQPDSHLRGFSALPSDGFVFEYGETAVIDAGGAGWDGLAYHLNGLAAAEWVD
ncbi:hypothetical protein RQM65_08205 [Pricia sp. S334]|uniref:Uncharacterized protein n=1 Tax=Pricia mediterranea TaxID=3076079 RepID=A0ABU3L5J1_9FLAO|nr:hypothetical protein [Pricia sp. S334]MDT7828643.1 hypothetical protein [Pricia sp. S334]